MSFVLMDIRSRRKYPLEDGLIFGRKCEGVILNDDSLSRTHFQIFLREGKVFIKDLESKNGTFVNDERLKPGEEVEVPVEGHISVGRKMFKLTMPEELQLQELEKIEKKKFMGQKADRLGVRAITFAIEKNNVKHGLLLLQNIFLTVFSLGLLNAKAWTDMRKFIWESIKVDFNDFKFTGTSSEIFFHCLKVQMVCLLFMGLLGYTYVTLDINAFYAIPVLVYVFMNTLYRRLRWDYFQHIVNRTSYQNIAFQMSNKNRAKYVAFDFGDFLNGLISIDPHLKREQLLWKSISYADCRFDFKPDYKSIRFVYMKLLIGTILLLGLGRGYYVPVYSFFLAPLFLVWSLYDYNKLKAKGIIFEERNLVLPYRFEDYVVQNLKTWGVFVATLGLGAPWVFSQNILFYARKLKVDGEIHLDRIIQHYEDELIRRFNPQAAEEGSDEMTRTYVATSAEVERLRVSKNEDVSHLKVTRGEDEVHLAKHKQTNPSRKFKIKKD